MQRRAKYGGRELCTVVEESHLFPCILGKPTQVREKSRRKELQDNVRKIHYKYNNVPILFILQAMCIIKNNLCVNCEEYTGNIFSDFSANTLWCVYLNNIEAFFYILLNNVIFND